MANEDDYTKPEFYRQEEQQQPQQERQPHVEGGFFMLPERFDAQGRRLIPIPVDAHQAGDGGVDVRFVYVTPEEFQKLMIRRLARRVWVVIEIAIILLILLFIFLWLIGVIHL